MVHRLILLCNVRSHCLSGGQCSTDAAVRLDFMAIHHRILLYREPSRLAFCGTF